MSACARRSPLLSPEERALAARGLFVGLVIDENRPEYEAGDFLIRGLLGAEKASGALALGRTARLVKLVIAIGAQAEGAVRSHTRRALAEEMRPEELRHVGLLALTTIGFPYTVAGLVWIKGVIGSKS